jgi:type IV pilus assembly protein PilW
MRRVNPSCPRRQPRGFTLVELMVSTVVLVIAAAAISMAFIFAQRAMQNEAQIKSAVEGARLSVGYLERTLRLAGYGLDPQHAFDFSTANLTDVGTTKDNFTPAGGAQFTTDDLAFRYRNPSWLRRGFLDAAATTTTLNLVDTTTFGVPLKEGQPIIVACRGGVDYAVFRTTAAVDSDDDSVGITEYGAPFQTNTSNCFVDNDANPELYVMLMHEVRVRVVDLGGRPFLVVFNNLDAPNDANQDFDPIAADVENFQVAYLMNRPRPGVVADEVDLAGNKNWILGDAADEAVPDPTAAAPLFVASYSDPVRFNAHPANIRAVRVNIVARSRRGGDDGVAFRDAPLAVENSTPASNLTDGFYRTLHTSTVRTGNMASRSFFTPALRKSGETLDFNYTGG